jgi:hypothetical protein
MKVYCEGCKYCKDGGNSYAVCTHPANEIRPKTYLNPWNHAFNGKPAPEFVKRKNPYIDKINYYNNCKLREQRPWWMFWRG